MNPPYYTGIHALSEIVYQKPGIASFPSLKSLPLKAGFTWGKASKNMSLNLDDKETILERHNAFLSTLDMPDFKNTILIDPTIYYSSDIEEVAKEDLDDDKPTVIGANFLITKDPSITLAVHPGDCPCAVIYTKDTGGNSLLGLLHMGRRQIDAQLPKKTIAYLKGIGIDTKDIIVSICPGISQKNYFIPIDESLPHSDKWGKYISLEENKEKEIYRLDLQGYIVQQFLDAKVLPQHIEIYTLDTYEATKNGESFSHRFSTVSKQPEKDGRFLLAASLI